MPYTLQHKRPYFLDTAPKIQPVVRPTSLPQPAVVVPRLDVADIVVLFDRLPITDTLSHRPLAMLNVRKGQKWAFEIDNGLDQAITANAVGSLTEDPATAPDVGVNVVVAANTREAIISDTWMPFVGVRLSATVAPTTGEVTVRGQVQVEE